MQEERERVVTVGGENSARRERGMETFGGENGARR